MWWISRARRMLTMPWRTRDASGSRWWGRVGVSGVVGVVWLVVLVVGTAVVLVPPSRAGADGLRSNAFRPARDSTITGPCEVYGWHEVGARSQAPFASETLEYHWADRVPTWRGGDREIVFADGNAVYAVSVDGTKLRRPVREDTTAFYVDGRWRYVLEGFVSLDVSDVDGALVYATCWAYKPASSDPRFPFPYTGVRLDFPAGDVNFHIGGRDLYEITVVRPAEGTVTRLYPGNFPVWSPDGRRIAFVSAYWRTVGGPAPPRVTRYDRLAAAGSDLQSRVQTIAADGTDLHTIELPAGKHAEFPPRWSPDGTRLAFLVIEEDPTLHYEAQGDATFAIYTVRADGTRLERLAEARSNPAWSPDGTRLVFVKPNRDGDLYLYTMAADGTDVRQVTATPAGSLQSQFRWVTALAWSPDGTRILYGCFHLVCVVGLDGQRVGEFPNVGHGAQLPAWSADGRWIALYNAVLGSRDEVVLAGIAPDGADRRVLVREHAGQLVAEQAWRRRGR